MKYPPRAVSTAQGSILLAFKAELNETDTVKVRPPPIRVPRMTRGAPPIHPLPPKVIADPSFAFPQREYTRWPILALLRLEGWKQFQRPDR